MSSLLGSYEKQYGTLTSEITFKLGKITRLAGDERRAEITATTKLIEETRELIEQMNLEIQELQPDLKSKYGTRILCYRQELDRLSREFKSPRYAVNAATPASIINENGLREELLYDSDIHTSLLSNTERLERTGKHIHDGLRTAYETEEIGGNILGELDQQRESLQRSRDRLRRTNDDLSKSSRILSHMYRRVLQNRLLLAVIAIFMCVVFFGTTYIMLFRRVTSANDSVVSTTHVKKSTIPTT